MARLDVKHDLPEELLKPLGFSGPRLRVLAVVAQAGPCTAASLMAELGLSRSALADHIAALEDGGLLIASPDPERQGSTGSGANRLVWAADHAAIRAMLAKVGAAIVGED